MNLVKVKCLEDFPSFGSDDKGFIAFKAGKTYVGEDTGHMIVMETEQDNAGNTRKIEMHKKMFPPLFKVEGEYGIKYTDLEVEEIL